MKLESPEVIDRCIGFLSGLANTGIEDKIYRTRIIISSPENLLGNTQQVIMDPTKGYGEQRPNIFSRNIIQAFKNWAMLMGCICIDTQGNILAVGRDIPGINGDTRASRWGISASSKFPCTIIEVADKDHIVVYQNGTQAMEVINEKKGMKHGSIS